MGVLGHQIHGGECFSHETGVTVRRLFAAKVNATAHTPLRIDLVGCPHGTAVNRCQGRALARTVTGTGRRCGHVNHGIRHPHVGAKYFPGGCQATGYVNFSAGGVALARQQKRGSGRIRIGITLVVFCGLEDRQTGGETFVGRVQLGTDFDVAALLGGGVGTECAVRIRIRRSVERRAPREVVRVQIVRLEQHANAWAPIINGLLVADGAGRANVVKGTAHLVIAQAAQYFPGGGDLHHILGVNTQIVGGKCAGFAQHARPLRHRCAVIRPVSRSVGFGDGRCAVDILSFVAVIDARN